MQRATDTQATTLATFIPSVGSAAEDNVVGCGIVSLSRLTFIRMKNMFRLSRVLLALLAGGGIAQAQFVAFNDHYQGPNSNPNDTFWNVFGTLGGAPGSGGPLKNITNGASVGVSLTITNVNVTGSIVAGAPDAATPAYAVFNGFIDWGNATVQHAPMTTPGASIGYVFRGMDPSKRYSLKATGVRAGGYLDRWEMFELRGAVSFRSAHTSGCLTNGRTDVPGAFFATNQVVINTGANNAGDLADWEEIDPGADGTITVVASQYTGTYPGGLASGALGYALMAIRFEEYIPVPTPVQITGQSQNAEVVEGGSTNFWVTISGFPPPTFQWYQNNHLISGATNSVYTISSAQVSDSGSLFKLVAANTFSNVTYYATSAPAQLTVDPDLTPPAVATLSPLAGSLVRELNSIEVDFSKPVAGVDAWDLLVNGLPASNLVILTPSQFVFEFVTPPTGTVQMAWAPNHGIHDLSAAGNAFAAGSWTYSFLPNLPVLGSLYITEFMAANKSFLRDQDGDYSDWIELYNNTDTQINLAGYGLSDDPNDLLKWQFPSLMLPARSYLYLFASGKNRTNALGRLHTNFQLNKGGGYLALSYPPAYVMDSYGLAYPPQTDDVSYGRARGDLTSAGFFSVPTPGAPNSASGAGFGPAVVFSRTPGTYLSPFSLTLSTPDAPGAEIRYVLVTSAFTDQVTNTVSQASPLYTGPVAIANAVQVLARAYVPNLLPGPLSVASYIQMTGPITNFTSDLPLLILHTVGNTTIAGGYPAPKTGVIMEFHDTTNNGFSSLTNKPDLVHRAGLDIHGSSTAGFPKSAWHLEVWDQYNADEKVPVLGMPAESDWILYAPNQFDEVLMHNPVAHALRNQMGTYSSRTRFVEVFLNTTGTALSAVTNSTGAAMGNYWGIYVIEEKIKQGANRVNVAKIEPEMTAAPNVTGGYMFKRDRAGANDRTFAAANDTLVYQYPDGLSMVTPQWQAQAAYLTGYWNSFWGALNGANWTNPVTGYAAWIDVNKWLIHHIHDVMTLNVDGLRLSGYLYKDRNGKICWGPAWDFDRTEGCSGGGDLRSFSPIAWMSALNQGGGADYGTDFFNNNPATYTNPWFSKLFQDPDFWQAWIDLYQQYRKTVYTPTNVAAVIDNFANQIRHAQPREVARWGGQGASDTTPRKGTVTASAGLPGAYTNTFDGTFQGEVNFLKKWWADRIHFVDTNLLNPPTLNSLGGSVPSGFTLTLTDNSGKAGTILYYTLDGSDPRGPGGNLNPKASAYTNTITLRSNARVMVRAMNPNHRNMTGNAGPTWGNPPLTSPWSSSAAETFYITAPPLVITEIMYHPENPPPGNTNDPSNFEYIELRNIGATPLSLIGFRFTNGIYYTFTASSSITNLAGGGYVLLVRNRAAFLSRYPGVTNIAGEYTDNTGQAPGTLNNAGDHLTLVGPLLEPVLDFTYSNTWLPMTDGPGFSLTIINETAPPSTWADPASWRLSGVENGTPGRGDAPPPTVDHVLVNEALSSEQGGTLTDAIEFYNPNNHAVNIGGWFLSDSFNTPKKYRIADGTIMAANGYLLFGQAQFGSGTNGFGLSSLGDSVYLFSADANGNLTGYGHGFGFGAAIPNVTFGRYVMSTGQEDFVLQISNTLGGPNADPLVGPVVISEIMYQPPDVIVGTNAMDDTTNEFVELHNILNVPVPLYDPAHPTNTWLLRGGISFQFPVNVTLPRLGYLLVVNFDPANDLNALASFRARYGLSPSVPLYGPYGGKLNNSGDNLELARPNPPVPPPAANAGFVPYVLMDKVKYSASVPWPCGSGNNGNSLQRFDVTQFGNDPINWVALLPAPGQPTPPTTPGLPTIVNQPQSVTTPTNTSVQFNVTVCGMPPYFFQWSKDTTPLPGANGPMLQLQNLQLGDAGVYTVSISNAAGVIVSSPAQLSVQLPPVILTQPVSLITTGYSRVTFNVVGGITPPFLYQWMFNGLNLLGQTNDTLVLPSAQPEQEGDYTVQLRNTAGTIVSAPAHLSLLLPAHVVIQPSDGAIGAGSNYTFITTILGSRPASAPLYYEWRLGGVAIAGGSGTLSGSSSGNINLSYPITNATIANAGYYSLYVSNQYGTDLTRSAYLDVLLKPRVIQQPPHFLAAVGEDVTFTVMTSGTLPLQVRWRKGSSQLTDYVALPGNVASLTLPNVVLTNAAWYAAVFKNSIYPNPLPTDSSAAGVLTVVKPPTNRLGLQGASVTLEALVKAGTNVFWAWELNGTNVLRGLNNSNFNTFSTSTISTNSLILTNLQAEQLGTYTFRLTNASFSFVTNVVGGTPVITTNWVPLGDPRSFAATVGFGIQVDPPMLLLSPASRTNRQGTTATFTNVATATWPVTYSWYLYGTNLVATTNSSSPTNILSLTNVQSAQMGDYTVVISNSAGVVTSMVATLTVQYAPIVLTQPQSQTALQGGLVVFAVVADGTQPVQYQWNRQTSRLAGETNSTLVVFNVQSTNLGNYWVGVTNVFGGVTSQWANLSYPIPPGITKQPTNYSAPAGTLASFSVTASGSAPLSFQWYSGGTPVSNGVSTTLLLPAVQAGQAGPYRVIVFNSAGSVTSTVATLTVTAPLWPTIDTQPADLTVLAGGTATFTVAASGGGGGPYGYQWFKDTGLLLNQTNTTLVLAGVQASQAGGYQAVVTSAGGSVTSRVAVLTVLMPPTITIQPTNQTVAVGGTATFAVAASGTAPLSYLWWFNGAPLLRQTNATLVLPGVTNGQAGTYFVFVTNVAGQAMSAIVSLTVLDPPRITAQPTARKVAQGVTVNFKVTATGSAPLSYRWRKDGLTLPGATAATLSLPNVQTNDAGSYSVVVSNLVGAVTSSAATLTVVMPPSITVQPISQTVAEGVSVTFTVAATGDTPLSYQWWKNGQPLYGSTTPTLTLSNVQTNDAGTYSVMVLNLAGAATSSSATLRVQYQRDYVFANTNLIMIPDLNIGVPYPSVIAVSNVDGALAKVTVTLSNLTHTWTEDLDALVVDPQGESVLFMSDAGGGATLGQTLTFDDSAASGLPQSGALATGTYQPTVYSTNQVLPAPAPAGPYGLRLSAFNGGAANGAWSLFARDDVFKDSGWIANGWSLVLRVQNVVTEVIPTGLRLGTPVPLGANQFQITITGEPGHVLDVLGSPDLARWTTNATLTNTTGTVIFTNSPSVIPHQFYRAHQQ